MKVSVDAVDGSLQYNFDVQSQVPAATLQAEIEKASGEPGQLKRPDGGSIDPKATLTQQGIVAVTSSDNPSHVAGDLASFDLTLTDSEMAALAKVA